MVKTMNIEELTKNVLKGYEVTKQDALKLVEQPLDDLTFNANVIRQYFCANRFDACTIINVKSGDCSEDCKFSAQSVHYLTMIEKYSLLTTKELIQKTQQIYTSGFRRVSYVASGRTITDDEFDTIKDAITQLKNKHEDIKICV